MGQEKRTQLGPALLGCFMQWGETPLVSGIDNSGVLDEEGSNVKVAI